MHSVSTGISYRAAGNNHQQIRFAQPQLPFLLVVLAHKIANFQQVLRALFYFIASELKFQPILCRYSISLNYAQI